MVTHQPKEGHPTKESVLKTWNVGLRHNSQNWHKVTTAMDGHLPSPGWWHSTIKNVGTNLPEDGHSFSKDGHQLSPEWLPTIPRRVTHHPKFCHPPTQGRLPTIIGRVTVPMVWLHTTNSIKAHHHPQDCYHFPKHSHPSSQGWSTRLKVWI